MNLALRKTTCHALVASLLTLSFHTAHAGLIGAEHAAPTPASADRTLILGTLERADVTAQLQALGVDPIDARQRVASMTDQEAHALAQDIQAAPAGAASGWGILAVLVIAGLVWYYVIRR